MEVGNKLFAPRRYILIGHFFILQNKMPNHSRFLFTETEEEKYFGIIFFLKVFHLYQMKNFIHLFEYLKIRVVFFLWIIIINISL